MFDNSNKLLSAIPVTLKLGEKTTFPSPFCKKWGEGIKGRSYIGNKLRISYIR